MTNVSEANVNSSFVFRYHLNSRSYGFLKWLKRKAPLTLTGLKQHLKMSSMSNLSLSHSSLFCFCVLYPSSVCRLDDFCMMCMCTCLGMCLPWIVLLSGHLRPSTLFSRWGILLAWNSSNTFIWQITQIHITICLCLPNYWVYSCVSWSLAFLLEFYQCNMIYLCLCTKPLKYWAISQAKFCMNFRSL